MKPPRRLTCVLCSAPSRGAELCCDCSENALAGNLLLFCEGCAAMGLPAAGSVSPEEAYPGDEALQALIRSHQGKNAVIFITDCCEECDGIQDKNTAVFGPVGVFDA